MRHLRPDYNGIQPWPIKRPHIGKDAGGKVQQLLPGEGELAPLIPDDEPVFLLRGQDPLAAELVERYAELYEEQEGADPLLIDPLRAWAAEMREHANRVKHGPADVPAGWMPETGR